MDYPTSSNATLKGVYNIHIVNDEYEHEGAVGGELVPQERSGGYVMWEEQEAEEVSAKKRKEQMHPIFVNEDVLFSIFMYLPTKDLMNASSVCSVWNTVAQHTRLWRKMSLKGLCVKNWTGLGKALALRRSLHLDTKGMWLPFNRLDTRDFWIPFRRISHRLDNLRIITIDCCPEDVVFCIMRSCPLLEELSVTEMISPVLTLPLKPCMGNLKKLHMGASRSPTSLLFMSTMPAFYNLKHLSLSMFVIIDERDVIAFGKLKHLETLELDNIHEQARYFIPLGLAKLRNLKCLTLKKLYGYELMNLVQLTRQGSRVKLDELHLMDVSIDRSFPDLIRHFKTLKKLVVATSTVNTMRTIHAMLRGVRMLAGTLEYFEWQVLELWVRWPVTLSNAVKVVVMPIPKLVNQVVAREYEWEEARRSIEATMNSVRVRLVSLPLPHY